MAADGGDFRFCASGQGEASHSSTAKIVEGEPDNADSDACFAPRRAKPVFCPRLLFGVQEDRAGFAAALIESRFQRCANRIRNALACFRLLYQGGAP